jgi:hypothetical protein
MKVLSCFRYTKIIFLTVWNLPLTPAKCSQKDLRNNTFTKYEVSDYVKNGKPKIVLTVSEIRCFCVLFQLHPDFSQLGPGCN